METIYLKEWFAEFPNLRFLLNREDKEVLSKINPREYQYHNLTQEAEVVRIINAHKPQAWKWVKMFPNLQNLPTEDYVILDHLSPSDYLGEITEADVRRIIDYRKSQAKKDKEKSDALKAKQYYENHKTDIEKEEKTRSSLTKVVKYTALGGIALLTTGIVLHSSVYSLTGAGLIILPLLSSTIRLKKLDKNSVALKSVKDDEKLDFITAVFVILYYIGFIGMGITLGMLPLWELVGWDTAKSVMLIGLSLIGASVILFLAIAIATSSNK